LEEFFKAFERDGGFMSFSSDKAIKLAKEHGIYCSEEAFNPATPLRLAWR
jgi:hypothetical protein